MGNGQKMKCKLKGSVNMKLQDEKMVKLTEVLYVPQAMKHLLSVSRLISKGATMGDTHDKIIIKKNGVGMTLGARKDQNNSTMFYLKADIYSPEGQEALTNLPEQKRTPVTKKNIICCSYQVRWT